MGGGVSLVGGLVVGWFGVMEVHCDVMWWGVYCGMVGGLPWCGWVWVNYGRL